MGLFDRWRRKRESAKPVKLLPPSKELENETKIKENNDLVNLVAEYERLVRRREELQIERRELTIKLDNGELDADEFRQQLMDKIQEAAQVSESLRVVSTKLTSLGYRGVLH